MESDKVFERLMSKAKDYDLTAVQILHMVADFMNSDELEEFATHVENECEAY